MRKWFLLLVCVFAGCLSLSAQVFLGIRDTRYAYVGYEWRDNWSITAENSIYIEHYKYQKTRLYVGYRNTWKGFTLKVYPYVGSTWGGSYQEVGALVGGEYNIFPIWQIDALVNPHYDTGVGYNTCFEAGTKVGIYKALSLVAHFTTIPEFRESEMRVRAGFDFTLGSLCVRPEVSIPVKDNVQYSRIILNFRYKF